MKTLSNVLEKKNIINKIYADSFEEAILEAYNNSDYNFFHNSELIDVENRFRIFEYNDINYIVKTMSKEKGVAEFNNSIKCAQLLNGKKINNYHIKVITSKLYKVDDLYYIATEYKGNTLQECLYTDNASDFTIQYLKEMIKIFSNLGIEYNGLCPRNMVVSKNENKIYLFDFENTKFFERIEYYNMLYRTNILVNWSYFYNQNDLLILLNSLQNGNISEPKLNSYEKNYKIMIGFSENDYELRKNIMNVVLNAEKRIDKSDLDYCLLPIDMASVISDLFEINMDVIMDMTFYLIRKYDENLYKKILHDFSKILIYSYKEGYELRTYLLPILIYAIDKTDSIAEKNFDGQLLNYYFDKDINKFKLELKIRLNTIFKEIYPNYKLSMLNIDELAEYLLKI